MIDIEAIKPALAELAKKHDLEVVALFGSQVTGRTHAKSDVDIAVLSRKTVNRARIALELDNIFKRDDIEVIDLALASPTLMHAVVGESLLLYEKNSGAFFSWKIYAIKIWMETAWLRRLANKQVIEWASQL